jgi:hypothetical protein
VTLPHKIHLNLNKEKLLGYVDSNFPYVESMMMKLSCLIRVLILLSSTGTGPARRYVALPYTDTTSSRPCIYSLCIGFRSRFDKV